MVKYVFFFRPIPIFSLDLLNCFLITHIRGALFSTTIPLFFLITDFHSLLLMSSSSLTDSAATKGSFWFGVGEAFISLPGSIYSTIQALRWLYNYLLRLKSYAVLSYSFSNVDC